MKRYEVPEDMKVKFDYNEADLPPSVVKFQPAVFRDGDNYCCLLGPDPMEGIFGCGPTLKEALLDWDAHLQEYIKEGKGNDEVTAYIKSKEG